MRYLLSVSTVLAAALAAVTLAPQPSLAQGQAPRAGQQQPAPPAPAKPYKAVPVTLPKPPGDPSLDAFRKQLADVAQKKDRAALNKMVAASFFWEAEGGNKADKKKSGADNLAAALNLAAKDGSGWDVLAGFAADPSAAPAAGKQGVMCSPADPTFDSKALEDLAKTTQTDMAEWGYPVRAGVEVRSGPQPNSPVVEKLGLNFVRVLPDDEASSSNQEVTTVRVATPSGKTGYVPMEALAPIGNDQICFVKEGGAWKVAGVVGGGGDQQ